MGKSEVRPVAGSHAAGVRGACPAAAVAVAVLTGVALTGCGNGTGTGAQPPAAAGDVGDSASEGQTLPTESQPQPQPQGSGGDLESVNKSADLPVVPDADPLTDQGWTMTEVDLDHSDRSGGPTVVHAMVVDTAHGDRDAALSLGIFDGGQLIWQGRATTVGGSDGDPETFYSASSAPSGDPATYDYVLRVDFTT